MFITFEGPDGSGKTTILKKLEKYLRSKNTNFISTREPGFKSKEGQKIRDIILDPSLDISPMAELILFSADRRLHLEKVIWPALKNNKIVLCDRYIDSSFAYQGFGREIGYKKVKKLQDLITEKTYPDFTFFFNLPSKISKERMKERDQKQDRLEMGPNSFKEKVNQGYKFLTKKYRQRYIIINANQTKEKVWLDVKEKIDNILQLY